MERNKSILTNKTNMESLFTIKDFPVSMSSVNKDYKYDKTLNMEFQICKDTGIIQLKKYPLFEDIYISAHNSSYGQVWNNLFDLMNTKISNLINKLENINILEIGGGSLKLANKILKTNKNITKYTVYEKNIEITNINTNINLVNEYFTNETIFNDKPDIILHSHVLEHVWNPLDFIKLIKKYKPKYHCFIVPNLQETFKKKYTNALNFEHNFFITEQFIDIILHNNNFDIIQKEYYLDHSIIYLTKYKEHDISIKKFPNMYIEYKDMAMSFYNYHITLVENINKTINNYKGNIYLFGGHIFSQFLICFGLNVNKIKCILDNSKEKNKKRLYGTNLIIEYPNIIKNIPNTYIILKAASYQDEIKKQLYEINNNIIIIE